MKFKLAFVAATLGVTLASGVSAQTVSVNVGANIAAACTMTQTPIAFGTYVPTAVSPLDATGTIDLTCTTGSIPIITVSTGANFSTTRRMASGANMLAYGIFLPGANTAAAACAYATDFPAILPGFTLTAAPSNSARSYNLCGRIPPGQLTAATGTYSDIVVASISF